MQNDRLAADKNGAAPTHASFLIRRLRYGKALLICTWSGDLFAIRSVKRRSVGRIQGWGNLMVRIASRSGLLAAASLVSLGFASSASANPGFGLIGDLVIQKPAPKPPPTQGPEDTKAAEPAKDAAKDGENYRLPSADKAKPDTSAPAPAAAPARRPRRPPLSQRSAR